MMPTSTCIIKGCDGPEHDCHSGVLPLCVAHWPMWVEHYRSVGDWGSGEAAENAMIDAWIAAIEAVV